MPLMRLWLSYQRYGLLLVVVIGLLIVVGLRADFAWWGWVLVMIAIAKLLPLCVHIFAGYRRKWRATELASRRIARGSFRPVAVRPWCGDPCWRIVAAEVLRRAGLPRAERIKLLRQLKAEALAQAHSLLIVDHKNGTLLKVEGDEVERISLPPQTT